MTEIPAWRAANQANWDERVPIHLAAPAAYDLKRLRAGTERLDPIAETVLGVAPGLRVLHRPATLEDVFLKLTGRDLRD